jgi:hypothetical protein
MSDLCFNSPYQARSPVLMTDEYMLMLRGAESVDTVSNAVSTTPVNFATTSVDSTPSPNLRNRFLRQTPITLEKTILSVQNLDVLPAAAGWVGQEIENASAQSFKTPLRTSSTASVGSMDSNSTSSSPFLGEGALNSNDHTPNQFYSLAGESPMDQSSCRNDLTSPLKMLKIFDNGEFSSQSMSCRQHSSIVMQAIQHSSAHLAVPEHKNSGNQTFQVLHPKQTRKNQHAKRNNASNEPASPTQLCLPSFIESSVLPSMLAPFSSSNTAFKGISSVEQTNRMSDQNFGACEEIDIADIFNEELYHCMQDDA